MHYGPLWESKMSTPRFATAPDKTHAGTSMAHAKPFSPYWLPGQDLSSENSDHVRTMKRKVLTNILNYLHFLDRPIFVHLQETDFGRSYLFEALPEPCLDGDVTCRWFRFPGINDSALFIRNLVIDDGKSMIIAPLEQPTFDRLAVKARLPETSYVLSKRKTKRFPCSGISVALGRKEGWGFGGELKDFSSSSFCVRLEAGSAFSRSFFGDGQLVSTELMRDGVIYFSGNCSVLGSREFPDYYEIALQPPSSAAPVFSKRTLRNPRVQLKPSATISFEHPLLQTRLQMQVFDICSSGFSVCEDRRECLLFPGMIIPDLNLYYADSIVMHCSVQVVYRNEDEGGNALCGIAILDTEINGYTRLNQLVESTLDPCARVSGKIEPDTLWEFFFSSGFIYPKKYQLLSASKELFKENCKEVFQDASDVIQHFTYENNGCIYGYHSIVHAYVRSWLIHHHAGRSTRNRMGGLMVLKQTMHYLNDMYRLKSSTMDYAMTYFRPENRFPKLVFGHFCGILKNRKECSMDLFSYLMVTSKFVHAALPSGWHLDDFTDSDAKTLGAFYEERSGGLLLKAISLDSGVNYGEEGLEEAYSRTGLFRKMRVYCLKHEGQLSAVLVADYSSRGLNFSELLNCLKVIVIREKNLSLEILRKAIMPLLGEYDMEQVPVMCYPSEFFQERGVPCQKTYLLWILSVDSGDAFIEYMHRRLRIR